MGMETRQDFRSLPGDGFNPDMRPGGGFGDDMRGLQRDPRSRDPRDRSAPVMPNMRGPPPPITSGPPPMRGGPPPQLPPHLAGADPEKAQLIMQVLQLTDEQIAMLPPEQRQSIMVLKEQISQGQR
jgi:cleavage stimulation factor subunit 2